MNAPMTIPVIANESTYELSDVEKLIFAELPQRPVDEYAILCNYVRAMFRGVKENGGNFRVAHIDQAIKICQQQSTAPVFQDKALLHARETAGILLKALETAKVKLDTIQPQAPRGSALSRSNLGPRGNIDITTTVIERPAGATRVVDVTGGRRLETYVRADGIIPGVRAAVSERKPADASNAATRVVQTKARASRTAAQRLRTILQIPEKPFGNLGRAELAQALNLSAFSEKFDLLWESLTKEAWQNLTDTHGTVTFTFADAEITMGYYRQAQTLTWSVDPVSLPALQAYVPAAPGSDAMEAPRKKTALTASRTSNQPQDGASNAAAKTASPPAAHYDRSQFAKTADYLSRVELSEILEVSHSTHFLTNPWQAATALAESALVASDSSLGEVTVTYEGKELKFAKLFGGARGPAAWYLHKDSVAAFQEIAKAVAIKAIDAKTPKAPAPSSGNGKSSALEKTSDFVLPEHFLAHTAWAHSLKISPLNKHLQELTSQLIALAPSDTKVNQGITTVEFEGQPVQMCFVKKTSKQAWYFDTINPTLQAWLEKRLAKEHSVAAIGKHLPAGRAPHTPEPRVIVLPSSPVLTHWRKTWDKLNKISTQHDLGSLESMLGASSDTIAIMDPETFFRMIDVKLLRPFMRINPNLTSELGDLGGAQRKLHGELKAAGIITDIDIAAAATVITTTAPEAASTPAAASATKPAAPKEDPTPVTKAGESGEPAARAADATVAPDAPVVPTKPATQLPPAVKTAYTKMQDKLDGLCKVAGYPNLAAALGMPTEKIDAMEPRDFIDALHPLVDQLSARGADRQQLVDVISAMGMALYNGNSRSIAAQADIDPIAELASPELPAPEAPAMVQPPVGEDPVELAPAAPTFVERFGPRQELADRKLAMLDRKHAQEKFLRLHAQLTSSFEARGFQSTHLGSPLAMMMLHEEAFAGRINGMLTSVGSLESPAILQENILRLGKAYADYHDAMGRRNPVASVA